MKAIILAAGAGTRLFSLQPKTLISIGGMTILQRTVLSLESLGVQREDITAVSGFRRDLIEKACTQEGISSVHNNLWRFPGTFSSFFHACEFPGEVLFLHGDLLWRSDLLSGISSVPGDIVVPVDPRGRSDPEAMKADVRGTRLIHLSKDLPSERSAGESMGVFLIRDNSRLKKLSAGLLYKPAAALDDAVNIAAGRMTVEVLFSGESLWDEIDTPDDLERAAGMFK